MKSADPIGLVVRAEPYRLRSARAQLDLALVAAAVGRPLQLYFIGASVLQLLGEREPAAAGLPLGYRGWGALTELTEVRAFAEADWLERAGRLGSGLLMPVEAMRPAAMRAHCESCTHVMVL